MLRINTKPRHRNAPRPAEKDCPQFRQWLRGRMCAADGNGLCDGRMVAAHVDHAGDKGMGTKVADRYCIPLCDGHHRRQHNKGWTTFEAECLAGRSAVALADAYWSMWPGRQAWEAKFGQ